MIQAIHSNQLYSETTIFSQGIVADEFTFLAVDTRQPDGSVRGPKRESSSAVKLLETLHIALNSCGQDLQNLVSLTVFLADYTDDPRHNRRAALAVGSERDTGHHLRRRERPRRKLPVANRRGGNTRPLAD